MTQRALQPFIRAMALIGLVLLPAATWASDWRVNIEERNGLPNITRGGGPAMIAKFSFFAQQWSWTGYYPTFTIKAPQQYTLAGENEDLNFKLSADIREDTAQSLTWAFDLQTLSKQKDVMGGGIVFNFDPSLFAGEMGAPQLLAGNRGWAWGKEGTRRIEMRFEPPLAKVYFERGNTDEVRALFYDDQITPGRQQIKATLSVTGDIDIGQTQSERFGLADPKRWPQDQLDWKTSPVDLSFLNAPERPAGKRGFVKADGERLVFADNTPVKFWGTNLSASALFDTSDQDIKQQAKRLSALGFNLVRLHHHDSLWVLPNIFGDGREIKDTQQLDAESLRKIDLWIKCLKDEGIYVWLDLHVQRSFMSSDGIYGFDELPKQYGRAEIKGYAYVNVTIQQRMKQFAEQYLTHVNRYTQLAYKDDPAIAAVLITNENDITHHYGNALLPDKKVPKHSELYMDEAKAFARRHDLPENATWRAWEHGPAKLFLNDLEQRFDADMIEHLRKIGVKVPIATTSTWGGNGLSSLPALTTGDVVDVHSYGGIGQLEKNPLISDGLVNWLGAAQVVGMPLTVTEWNNESFPLPDRHSLPLYVAGTASHQGWDALMQYAYSQGALTEGKLATGDWHAYNDPGVIATLPAAALLYRRGDVRPAQTRYVFAPSADTLFNRSITPSSSVLLRTAMEKGMLQIAMPQTPQLPWLKPSVIPPDAQVLRDPDQSLLDANAKQATTDTGEITRNWQQGVYTIDTPMTQAASGWLGGRSISLANVQVQLKTPNASVVVQSLDGQPLGQSRSLLVSLGSQAVPKEHNNTPFYVEPLEGALSIKAAKGLKVYGRSASGEEKALPATYKNGRYTLTFDGQQMTNWLFLK